MSLADAPHIPTLPIDIVVETRNRHRFQKHDAAESYSFRIWDEKRSDVRQFPAQEYLDALLSITSANDCEQILIKYGNPVHVYRPFFYDSRGWDNKPVTYPFLITSTDVKYIQQDLKSVMVVTSAKLLNSPQVKALVDVTKFNVAIEKSNRMYRGKLVLSADWESCISFLVFQRLLSDINYKLCENCETPFEVTSGHFRKYCSAECGHVVAQRNYRRKNPR